MQLTSTLTLTVRDGVAVVRLVGFSVSLYLVSCTSVGQSGCSPGRGDIQEGSETDLHRQLSEKMGWWVGGGRVRA